MQVSIEYKKCIPVSMKIESLLELGGERTYFSSEAVLSLSINGFDTLECGTQCIPVRKTIRSGSLLGGELTSHPSSRQSSPCA